MCAPLRGSDRLHKSFASWLTTTPSGAWLSVPCVFCAHDNPGSAGEGQASPHRWARHQVLVAPSSGSTQCMCWASSLDAGGRSRSSSLSPQCSIAPLASRVTAAQGLSGTLLPRLSLVASGEEQEMGTEELQASQCTQSHPNTRFHVPRAIADARCRRVHVQKRSDGFPIVAMMLVKRRCPFFAHGLHKSRPRGLHQFESVQTSS